MARDTFTNPNQYKGRYFYISSIQKGTATNPGKIYETAGEYKDATTAVLTLPKYYNDNAILTTADLADLISYRNDDYITEKLPTVLEKGLATMPERLFEVLNHLSDKKHLYASTRRRIASQIFRFFAVEEAFLKKVGKDHHDNKDYTFLHQWLDHELCPSDTTGASKIFLSYLEKNNYNYLSQCKNKKLIASICRSDAYWQELLTITKKDPFNTFPFLNSLHIYLAKNFPDLIQFYLDNAFNTGNLDAVNIMLHRPAFLKAFMNHWNNTPNLVDSVTLPPEDAAEFIKNLINSSPMIDWENISSMVEHFCDKYKSEEAFITPLLQLENDNLKGYLPQLASVDAVKELNADDMLKLLISDDFINKCTEDEIIELLEQYTEIEDGVIDTAPTIIETLLKKFSSEKLLKTIFNEKLTTFAERFIEKNDLPGDVDDFELFSMLCENHKHSKTFVALLIDKKNNTLTQQQQNIARWLIEKLPESISLLANPTFSQPVLMQYKNEFNDTAVLLNLIEQSTEDNAKAIFTIISTVTKSNKQALIDTVTQCLSNHQVELLFKHHPDALSLVDIHTLIEFMQTNKNNENYIKTITQVMQQDNYQLSEKLAKMTAEQLFALYQTPEIMEKMGGPQTILGLQPNPLFQNKNAEAIKKDYYQIALTDPNLAAALLNTKSTFKSLEFVQRIRLAESHHQHPEFLNDISSAFFGKNIKSYISDIIRRKNDPCELIRNFVFSTKGKQFLPAIGIKIHDALMSVKECENIDFDKMILNLDHLDYHEYLSDVQKGKLLVEFCKITKADPNSFAQILLIQLLTLRPSFDVFKNITENNKNFGQAVIANQKELFNNEILNYEQLRSIQRKITGILTPTKNLKIQKLDVPKGREPNIAIAELKIFDNSVADNYDGPEIPGFNGF